MNIYTLGSKNIFVALFLFATVFAYAEPEPRELLRQKFFADSLFDAGNYYASITEYKRLLFFDSRGDYDFYANYRIALAYKAGAFWRKAIAGFEKAEKAAGSDSLKALAKRGKIKVMILSRETRNASDYINKLEAENFNRKELDYWRGWNYLLEGDLELSRYYFEQSGKAEALAKTLKTYGDSLYSVSTVKLMSYIIPGAGQIYTGEYFSGIISFAWNALWIYVTADAFSDGRILEGFLVGDLLWLRFYRGNVQNAEKFAKEKNVKLVNRLLENLQNNYRGEKP